MSTESNIVWRSAKAGIASGATIWSVAYLVLPVAFAFFGIPIPPLALDVVGSAAAFAYGGRTAYKRYKAIQAKESEGKKNTDAFEWALYKAIKLTQKIDHPKGENEAFREKIDAILGNQTEIIITPPKLLGSKLERSIKAFMANFPVAKTGIAILLGVSFLAITPAGWVIIAASAAAGLAWGITAAVKKWQMVSIEEKLAHERQQYLEMGKNLCAAIQEELGQKPALTHTSTNTPVLATEKSLAADIRKIVDDYKKKGATLFDDGIDLVGDVIKVSFSALLDTIKRNKTVLFSGVMGAASGFAMSKAALAIGLPLLVVAGVVAPPSLLIMGIAVVCAVTVGFAVGKAKQIYLKQVEDKSNANKKSLDDLDKSINEIEKQLEQQPKSALVSTRENSEDAAAEVEIPAQVTESTKEELLGQHGCKLPKQPEPNEPDSASLEDAAAEVEIPAQVTESTKEELLGQHGCKLPKQPEPNEPDSASLDEVIPFQQEQSSETEQSESAPISTTASLIQVFEKPSLENFEDTTTADLNKKVAIPEATKERLLEQPPKSPKNLGNSGFFKNPQDHFKPEILRQHDGKKQFDTPAVPSTASAAY